MVRLSSLVVHWEVDRQHKADAYLICRSPLSPALDPATIIGPRLAAQKDFSQLPKVYTNNRNHTTPVEVCFASSTTMLVVAVVIVIVSTQTPTLHLTMSAVRNTLPYLPKGTQGYLLSIYLIGKSHVLRVHRLGFGEFYTYI